MCLPAIPMAMMAMAAVSSTVGVIAQSETANAQVSAINNQTRQAYAQNQAEEQQQENDNLRATRRADANIQVAAGEAGLSLGSGSIETMLLNNHMQTVMAGQNIELNTKFKNDEVENGAQRALSEVNKPNLLDAGLQIGMSAANGYLQGQNLQLQRQALSPKAAAPGG